MKEYFQEAGRCGRDSYDISEEKNLSENMRKVVQLQSCKRQFILKYFGYTTSRFQINLSICAVTINAHVMSVCYLISPCFLTLWKIQMM